MFMEMREFASFRRTRMLHRNGIQFAIPDNHHFIPRAVNGSLIKPPSLLCTIGFLQLFLFTKKGWKSFLLLSVNCQTFARGGRRFSFFARGDFERDTKRRQRSPWSWDRDCAENCADLASLSLQFFVAFNHPSQWLRDANRWGADSKNRGNRTNNACARKRGSKFKIYCFE